MSGHECTARCLQCGSCPECAADALDREVVETDRLRAALAEAQRERDEWKEIAIRRDDDLYAERIRRVTANERLIAAESRALAAEAKLAEAQRERDEARSERDAMVTNADSAMEQVKYERSRVLAAEKERDDEIRAALAEAAKGVAAEREQISVAEECRNPQFWVALDDLLDALDAQKKGKPGGEATLVSRVGPFVGPEGAPRITFGRLPQEGQE